LEIFFDTHDPTTLNRQGNDVGTQYRSGVYYHSEEQKDVTEAYISDLEQQNTFANPIVTEISAFEVFYAAEIEHKDYYNLNKNQPYCAAVISPKVKKLVKNYSSKIKTL
jgi:peptide-methionine (S)-S-oxide reductase